MNLIKPRRTFESVVRELIAGLEEGTIVLNKEADGSKSKESEICGFLEQYGEFSPLTRSTLANIAKEMEIESHPAGTVIIRQYDESDKFYLIKKGLVDVIVNQGQPDEAKAATLGRGSFFGVTALLTSAPGNATATFIAQQDVECYTLDEKASPTTRRCMKELLDHQERRTENHSRLRRLRQEDA